MLDINETLDLPCGVQIKNRICKGAMTEGLADSQNRATFKHVNLYDKWSSRRPFIVQIDMFKSSPILTICKTFGHCTFANAIFNLHSARKI